MDQRDWSNSLTTTTTPDKFMYDTGVGQWGPQSGLYQGGGNPISRPSTSTQTYSGTGGTFSRPVTGSGINPSTGRMYQQDTGMGGTWTSGEGGPQITNMQGYLGMKEQQQAGADFSGYQNRLNTLLGDNNQDRYQTQLDALLRNPSSIENTPGYQFQMDQGNQAINRSAAAKGMSNSGGVLAELAKYGQGLASQEYGNTLGRLSSLSQSERQNKLQNVNQLQNMIQGSQQFGLNSGYYNPAQYTQSLGIGRK